MERPQTAVYAVYGSKCYNVQLYRNKLDASNFFLQRVSICNCQQPSSNPATLQANLPLFANPHFSSSVSLPGWSLTQDLGLHVPEVLAIDFSAAVINL